MNKVDEYISSFHGAKIEWLTALVSFMREIYPQISETFDHKMPIYQGDGFYVAFAAQKSYFSFYTDDVRVLSLIKDSLPGVSLGKSVARVKYSANEAVEVLIDVIKEVVDYHNARRSDTVTDIKALKKWATVPLEMQQKIIANVFCSKCGVTTMVNYSLHDDRFGIALKGKCKKCGAVVARFVEDE
ncbi:MAG TPA: DUF1801 domain-containing protein [Desulfosporosinus sp.]|nr:DUF1801 domain-containing protein [Desulfosporosinus sp.]